jgi:hypothetical protein
MQTANSLLCPVTRTDFDDPHLGNNDSAGLPVQLRSPSLLVAWFVEHELKAHWTIPHTAIISSAPLPN